MSKTVVPKYLLPEIVDLYDRGFDRVAIEDGSNVVLAQYDTELPVLGPVTISIFDGSLGLYPQGRNSAFLFRNTFDVTGTAEEITARALRAFKKGVAEIPA